MKSATTSEVILTLSEIVSWENKHRSFGDLRRKMNYVIASYRGSDGKEYRKAFESYGTPNVPKQGTNKEITAMRNQSTL